MGILRLEKSKLLTDRAYEALKKLIITGELGPHELYSVQKLATALGVSRTPVREALIKLSKEGIVSFISSRGVKINKITRKEVADVFEIRRIVEGYVVSAILDKLTSSDISKLKKMINRQKECADKDDKNGFIEEDKSIHLFLASRTSNKKLENILLDLRNLIHLLGIKAVTEYKGRMKQVIEEHEMIVLAIEERDAEKARTLMVRHLENTEKILDSHFDEENAI